MTTTGCRPSAWWKSAWGLPPCRWAARRSSKNACRSARKPSRNTKHLWQRLGLSVDWRYTYRTIDEHSRRISQLSFLDLYRKGLVYRQQAPAIWCPECHTSIAQAELNDLERESEFVTLAFRPKMAQVIPIATTRPELLPACVAVFVHPDDPRYRDLVGRATARAVVRPVRARPG